MTIYIEEKRKSLNMSQAQLAQKMNVNQTAISQWERGSTMPTSEKLPQLAAALQCSVGDLFQQTEHKEA